MKPYPLNILLIALAADSGSCFVPTSLARSVRPADISTIGTVDTIVSVAKYPLLRKRQGPLYSSTGGEDVPLDTKSIISAYEAWRTKFGKGDFNIDRYHNFENNYRVLTAANIKARDKAIAEGKTAPQWLELNEYGDYSREEYKAMNMKGGPTQAATPPASTSASTSPSPSVSVTQQIMPPASPAELPNKTPGRGTQIIIPAPPSNPAKATAQSTGTSSLYGPPSGSSPSPASASASTPSYGTQVVQQSKPSTDANSPPPSYGTQVVQQSKSSKTPSYGTQVIQSAPASNGLNDLYGPPGSAPPVSQTPTSTTMGTQVIRQGNTSPQPRGTQVISKAPSLTTSDVGSLYGAPSASVGGGPAPRGTQVIQPAGRPANDGGSSNGVNSLYGAPTSGSTPRGTQVIRSGPSPTPPRGTQVIRQGKPPQSSIPSPQVDNRGTYVVQPSVTAPRSTQIIPQGGKSSTNTKGMEDFMNTASSQGTQVIQGAGQKANEMLESSTNASANIVQQATESIFSLFGGEKKNEDDESRKVRGTIQLQGGNGSSGGASDSGEKKTVLVDKWDIQSKIPSIFSFFGGAQKNEDDVNPAPAESSAAATPEPATASSPGRPTLVIEKQSVDFPGTTSGYPEVRRWWQNADGTITGFIFNSKIYNDGTKLTTSKLARPAVRSGNILRSGGEDYILL